MHALHDHGVRLPAVGEKVSDIEMPSSFVLFIEPKVNSRIVGAENVHTTQATRRGRPVP
jgi:hypothetical protein